jgi:hypothetical protein
MNVRNATAAIVAAMVAGGLAAGVTAWVSPDRAGRAVPTTSPSTAVRPSTEPSISPQVIDLSGTGSAQVQNASATIACGFDSEQDRAVARCDVKGSWHVAAPAECHGGYGDSADLGSAAGPELGCHTDTVFTDQARFIPADAKVVYRDLTCVFGDRTVTCVNGHGGRFTVSPTAYSFG